MHNRLYDDINLITDLDQIKNSHVATVATSYVILKPDLSERSINKDNERATDVSRLN